jgi:putative MATE family efflux protein
MNILTFLLSVLIGLTTGASVIISQYYGAKQNDKVEQTVSTSIIFLAVFSVLVTILGVIFSPLLLQLLDTPAESLNDAILYLRILMGGMIFPIFYNMYTAYLRALGNSRSSLYILICCTVLNIILDLFFVTQFHMGVLGVAVATVIAQGVSVLLCYLYAQRYVPLLRIKKLFFDKEIFQLILKYGFPAAVQLSVVSFASLTITRLINSFGTAAMAGITASTKVDQLAITPVSNISMALATFVAQNMGAKQEQRARMGLASATIFMIIVAVSISGILIIFGPQLISLFLNQGDTHFKEIRSVGLGYLNILVGSYFLFAILFAFNGFFRGVGDAVMAMVFPVSSLIIRTISAYMLVELVGMGPESLAWSIPIGWGITSFASWIYYQKNRWQGKSVAITVAEQKH